MRALNYDMYIGGMLCPCCCYSGCNAQQWPIVVLRSRTCRGSSVAVTATLARPYTRETKPSFDDLESVQTYRSLAEKDTKLAQKLGQLQPFLTVLPQECMSQLASLAWANSHAGQQRVDCDTPRAVEERRRHLCRLDAHLSSHCGMLANSASSLPSSRSMPPPRPATDSSSRPGREACQVVFSTPTIAL
jgi:hypothetical protein